MATSPGGAPSHLFTTLRYDPGLREDANNTAVCGGAASPVYMMAYHHDRLREAAAAMVASRPGIEHRWLLNLEQPEQIAHVCAAHVQPEASNMGSEDRGTASGAWRCAVYLSIDGAISVKSAPAKQTVQPLLFPTSLDSFGKPLWTVVMDSQTTEPSLATSFKTSDRDMYNRAREAADISSPLHTKEVLLYSTSDLIMDGSITTPYFFREGGWVTPPTSSGGQLGVTRRWSLQHGLCSEGTVSRHSVEDGETVWLSNAFRGFFPATFRDMQSVQSLG